MGGTLWAPKNQKDFNWIQSLTDQEFYLGVVRDGDKWRYDHDNSIYPQEKVRIPNSWFS